MKAIKTITLFFILLFCCQAHAGEFTGTYTCRIEEVTMELKLIQDDEDNISGTLDISTEGLFNIIGGVEKGVASGMCTSARGVSYYTARFVEGKLIFTFINPDEFGVPNFDTARNVIMIRKNKPDKQKDEELKTPASPEEVPAKEKDSSIQQPEKSKVSGGVITDPNWGFKFTVSDGWKYKYDHTGAVLGHDTIPGVIVVFPHNEQGESAVRAALQEGLNEGTTELKLIGGAKGLVTIGNNALAGDYEGKYEGTQAKARGVGTFSPYGGGAYIIAVTTPKQYSKRHMDEAHKIARSMEYFKVNMSDLMRHFAGKWTNYTKYTQTDMYLSADGRYFDHYESSYAGDLTDQSGDVTATWLAGADENADGHWSVRGNKNNGVITVTYNNGKEYVMEYSVHVENDKVYWGEYYFNAKLYSKSDK